MRKWAALSSAIVAVFLFFTLLDFKKDPQNSFIETLNDESFVDPESEAIQSDPSGENANDPVDPSQSHDGNMATIPDTGNTQSEIEIAPSLNDLAASEELDLEVFESVDTETAYKLINIASSLADYFHYEAAIAWANDAVRLDPGLPEAHLMSGYLNFKLLNTEKAIADFEKTIELDPRNFDAHMYLGRIYNGNDNPTLGMEYLTRAIEFGNNPREISLGFAYRAFSHALIDQYDQAIEDLEDALNLDPDNGWAIFFQGIILEEIEAKEEALDLEGVSGESIGIAK